MRRGLVNNGCVHLRENVRALFIPRNLNVQCLALSAALPCVRVLNPSRIIESSALVRCSLLKRSPKK